MKPGRPWCIAWHFSSDYLADWLSSCAGERYRRQGVRSAEIRGFCRASFSRRGNHRYQPISMPLLLHLRGWPDRPSLTTWCQHILCRKDASWRRWAGQIVRALRSKRISDRFLYFLLPARHDAPLCDQGRKTRHIISHSIHDFIGQMRIVEAFIRIVEKASTQERMMQQHLA